MLKCGFIEYLNGSSNNEAKKVFFHVSDIIDSSELKSGDEVEFVLVHNSRNGKSSATKIKKISSGVASLSNSKSSGSNLIDSEQKRPERLNSRLKIANIDDKSGKQLILIRQPLNPDAKIKSFSRVLKERLPGFLNEGQTPQFSLGDQ